MNIRVQAPVPHLELWAAHTGEACNRSVQRDFVVSDVFLLSFGERIIRSTRATEVEGFPGASEVRCRKSKSGESVIVHGRNQSPRIRKHRPDHIVETLKQGFCILEACALAVEFSAKNSSYVGGVGFYPIHFFRVDVDCAHGIITFAQDRRPIQPPGRPKLGSSRWIV